MIEVDRTVSANAKVDDEYIDRAIRPKLLSVIISVNLKLESKMEIFIQAAKLRQDALDHLLLLPPRTRKKQRWRILLPMKWE